MSQADKKQKRIEALQEQIEQKADSIQSQMDELQELEEQLEEAIGEGDEDYEELPMDQNLFEQYLDDFFGIVQTLSEVKVTLESTNEPEYFIKSFEYNEAELIVKFNPKFSVYLEKP